MFLTKIRSLGWAGFKADANASVVLFLVSMPLCLGMAMASGTPLVSGLIAGIIGGMVVSVFSGTEISVSGPAAGLVIVVSAAIAQIGSFSGFLVSVVLAGAFQVGFSFLRLGWVSSVVPFPVVRGMLAGIGATIVLKQIPHALGQDIGYEGDLDFFKNSFLENTFTDIFNAWQSLQIGALVVSVSLVILWVILGRFRIRVLRPLVLVLASIGINVLFFRYFPQWHLSVEAGHLLNIPMQVEWNFPDWSMLSSSAVWTSAVMISAIVSMESLLTLEAADQLDPINRLSDGNKELRAQGIGNILSGLLGGIPIASVVLPTAANIYSGAQTRLSSFLHGSFILISVFLLARFFQLIPLATIAIFLILIGIKLVKLSFPKMDIFYRRDQFLPFVTTAILILLSNLIIGVFFGALVGIYFMLKANQHAAMTVVSQNDHYLIRFNRNLLFIHTSDLKEILFKIPNNSYLTIDATTVLVIDQDVRDVISIFEKSCKRRNIKLRLNNL